MNFFSFDLRKILLSLFIVAIPLVMLNIDRNPEDTAWYKIPVQFLSGAINSSYNGFAHSISNTTHTYLDLVGLNREVAAIHKENDRLKAEMRRIQELEMENMRFRQLLDFRELTPMSLMPAQVVSRDISADHYTLMINKGTRHGLKKLQGIISTDGVVGYVLDPREDSSQILLLTDRLSSVDAIVQRTRARGIVSGRNRNTARLRYLERPDNVRAGDLVVTSGLQGYFPKGFPIGTVIEVKSTEYGISQEAYIEPSIDSSRLEEVFVVLDSKKVDFSSLFGPSNLMENLPPPAAVIAPAEKLQRRGN